MMHMDTNDFYEDDESTEERRKAWRTGESGRTKGPRDMNQRAKAIVDRVVERWDAPTDDAASTIRFYSDPELLGRDTSSVEQKIRCPICTGCWSPRLIAIR